MQIWSDYRLGYQSRNDEIPPLALEVKGYIPDWLNGTLIRNGPAKYDIGNQKMQHWFDGFAKLHKFTFNQSKILYASRFLTSHAYTNAMHNGKISSHEFATNPTASLWGRLSNILNPNLTDNANVNTCKLGNKYLAMTETAYPLLFDLPSLETMGKLNYQDNFKCQLTTAHPHFDFSRNVLINLATVFGLSSKYVITGVDQGAISRKTIASIPVKSPGYMHSFAVTENYIVLVEFPFTVNPLELIFSGKPYIENYHWHKDQATRILLINKNGTVSKPIETDSCFAFHHVNAFEYKGEIMLDLLTYPDSSIVHSLYLDNLLSASKKLEAPQLQRYQINLSDYSIKKYILFSDRVELPRINYKLHNGKNYRYAYAIGQSNDNIYLDQLTKLDLVDGKPYHWRQENCFPGEPVFVPSPQKISEDDGLLLSIVLDVKEQRSFVLVLNATNMEEMARAIMPNIMPFGFHGQFYGE